jgi:futalosine hydrolase
MRILIVAATDAELAPIVAHMDHLRQGGGRPPKSSAIADGMRSVAAEIEYLTTGVGMVATAAWCSRRLAEQRYDFALNVGVCGSFDAALVPGTVVHVIADRIAELGAEDDDAFLAFADLTLPGESEFVNPTPSMNPALAALPAVRGITVNTVHGNARSIAAVVRRFNPQVESMEGAAFMSACLIHQVPFAQLRAVSNVVEKRNRAAWKLAEAIENLARAAIRVLEAA